MNALDGSRYGIAEASDLVGVAPHVLRQWEERFPQFRPKRDRAGRRVYGERDIAVARRIKELLRDDKLTGEGASKALARELRGEAPPKTRHETNDVIDRIDDEIRAMLDLLDAYDDSAG
jgi:DNA-binding transcriptional MerR regulator